MTVKRPVEPTDDRCFNVVIAAAAAGLVFSRPEQSDLPPSQVMRKYLLML